MILTNDFNLLEVSPTTDIKQIKRAYAKCVKKCSPEEDAFHFQLLREAYERVLYNAENSVDTFEVYSSDTSSEYSIEHRAAKDNNDRDLLHGEATLYEEGASWEEQSDQSQFDDYNDYDQWEYDEESETNDSLISDFFRNVHEVYSDNATRNDIGVWSRLMKHEALWSLDERRFVSKMLLDKIAEGMYLEEKIIRLLNEFFLWEEEEGEDFFDADYHGFYKYIKDCIDHKPVPGYECLKQNDTWDSKDYIYFRESGYIHFLERDWENAAQSYMKAYEMYPEESYLLCLMGALQYAENNEEEGQLLIEHGIKTAQEKERLWVFCGQMLYYSKAYDKSIQYLKMITPNSIHFGDALMCLTHSMCAKKEHYSCHVMLKDLLWKGICVSVVEECMRMIYYDLSREGEVEVLDYRKWKTLQATYPFVDSIGKNPIKPWAKVSPGIAILLIFGSIIVALIIVSIHIPIVGGILVLLGVCYKIWKDKKKKKLQTEELQSEE